MEGGPAPVWVGAYHSCHQKQDRTCGYTSWES
jgi:hypothetical protein